MLIECNGCPVRETHCDGCMVTALLATVPVGSPTAPRRSTPSGPAPQEQTTELADLDPRERAAVTALTAAGLIGPDQAAAARAEVRVSSAQLWQAEPVRSAAGRAG